MIDIKTRILIFSILLSLYAGFFIGLQVGERASHKAAIENGAAYYSPDTGDFTWIQRKPVEIRRTVISGNAE